MKHLEVKTLIKLVIFYLIVSSHPTAVAESIRIGGTGASHGVMIMLKNAYTQNGAQDELTIVPPMGSVGGIKALRAGALDIAVIGRELAAEDRATDLESLELGRTPFVLIANRNVHKKFISLTELAEIFDGTMKYWPNGIQVRAILRPATDIDLSILKSMSERMAVAVPKSLAREGMIYGYTDKKTADEVEQISGAISTSTLALVLSENRKVSVLAIDGVTPSTANLQSGRYPYFKTLHLVTRAGASPGCRKFIAFIKSKKGQRLLEQHGIIVTHPR